MTSEFKRAQSQNKCATVPIPGEVWDRTPPQAQMAIVVMEMAKFMGTPHFQNFGGFRIVATYPTSNPGQIEMVDILSIGQEPTPEKPAIIVPPRGIIKPN